MQVTRVSASSENDLPHSGHSDEAFDDLVLGSMPLLASRLYESLCDELHKEPSNRVMKVWLQAEDPGMTFSASTETGMRVRG